MIAPVDSRRSKLAPWLPWICGGLLGAWCLLIMIIAARVDVLGRFDDGIEYTTVTYLLHGQLPYTDFYEPYGLGLGVPGVIPHIFGFDSVLALRLVYGLFPPLVTLLVTPLIWRRCGPAMGVIVGLITLTSTTPRYSMGFAALFGFALMVEFAVRRTSTGTLQQAAEEHPRLLLAASAVCSLAGWARTEYAVGSVAGHARYGGASHAVGVRHGRAAPPVVVRALHPLLLVGRVPCSARSADRMASA
jgi:hypothetical protein